jgi:hypothetical protein
MSKSYFSYLLNGKPIDRNDLAEFPVTVAGNDLPDKDTVYVFDSEGEFNKWKKANNIEEKFSKIDKIVTQAQEYEQKDITYALQRQQLVIERITADLHLLAHRLGLDVNSPELFRRATVEADLLEGQIFDPSLAFQNPDFQGLILPIPTGSVWPYLSWWEDRFSSMLVTGNLLLTQHRFFRGRRLWLTGVAAEFRHLGDFNFEDITSSVVHT